MGSKISALTSAANLLGSTKKLALANAGFVVPDGWASAVAIPLTGSTNETALATIAIPAGAMGANGILRVTTLWEAGANNANAKTARVRLGGIGGTIFQATSVASTLVLSSQWSIANRGAQNSQIANPSGMGAGGWGTSSGGATTGSVDTSAAQDLVISGQLASGADTLTLQRYLVEILYKA